MEIPVQLQTTNFSIKTLQIDQVYFDSATIQDEKFEQNKELDENYNHTNNDDVESNKQRKNSILSVLNNAFHNPLTSSTGGYKQTGDDRENSRKNSVLYTFHPSNPLTSSSNGKHRNNSANFKNLPIWLKISSKFLICSGHKKIDDLTSPVFDMNGSYCNSSNLKRYNY